MFQVILHWNLLHANNIIEDSIPSETFRGYNKEVFISSELINPLKNPKLKPLSVSDIADIKCPSRIDLYYKKGKNRQKKPRQSETWGSKAGPIVEKYFLDYLSNHDALPKKYNSVSNEANAIHEGFLSEKREDFEKLETLENDEFVDTQWLKKLLCCGGRAELGVKVLHSLLKEKTSINATDIFSLIDVEPDIEIGISTPSRPDFIIPKSEIVGDIKSGIEFLAIHQLTCAGYALAYENANKTRKMKINWGIIYFFPTRNPRARVKPITFPQLYIFPIDDYLRSWFIDERDKAYQIISKDTPPAFPKKIIQCSSCKFLKICISAGLKGVKYVE